MKQRIQKVLTGVESRRHIEQMVLDGRISVNGRVASRLPLLVDPATDKIEVDGELVKVGHRGRFAYVLMNKPKGVYCTNVSQGVQTRAIDLLPPKFAHRVYPVGRLDADSRGLLLLTDDGELTFRLTHPSFGVERTYRATIDGRISDDSIQKLREGVWLGERGDQQASRTDKAIVKATYRSTLKSTLEITLSEGRNRQIRRMLANLGHKVRDLIRLRLGPLNLKGLSSGQSRPLTGKEISQLKALVGMIPGKKGKKGSDSAFEEVNE